MAVPNKVLKPILSFISNKYNIPYDNLKTEIENIINTMPSNTEYNPLKCHAYIMRNGNKEQCSRSKIDDNCNFCKTHNRHNINNELKYGKIDINKISKQHKPKNNKQDKNKSNNDLENIKYNENKKKQVEVEYLNINDIDYLFNPITKYVYDFETKRKIGKLDNDCNIIKRSKISSSDIKFKN